MSDDYSTSWGNSRATFYGLEYIPTVWFEGLDEYIGSSYYYSDYEGFYEDWRAVPTDVTIDTVGDRIVGQSFRIRSEVCLEAGGTGKTVRVYTTQVLDHWPTTPTYSRNTFIQAAAAADVVLSPGACETVERFLTVEDESWANQEDVKIIVWAQRPFGSGPAEVYQADVMTWPFPGTITRGDFDNDEDVDQDDYDAFVLCFTGAGGGPLSDECRPGDFDYDDDVDCDDWLLFVAAWTDAGDPPDYGGCAVVDPLSPSWPHTAYKNRYISFDPNPGEHSVAYQVELAYCEMYPDYSGVVGWVGEPDADGISRLVAEPYFADAAIWPSVVHVGDCAIAPTAYYDVRATVSTTDSLFSEPLRLLTSPVPMSAHHWGDVVGMFWEGAWTEPNLILNFNDISAQVMYFENPGGATVHLTWVDIDGEVPDKVLSFSDIMRLVQAFQGDSYPFSAPENCP